MPAQKNKSQHKDSLHQNIFKTQNEETYNEK